MTGLSCLTVALFRFPVGRSFTRFFVSLRLSLHLTHFSRRYGGKGEAGTREAKM